MNDTTTTSQTGHRFNDPANEYARRFTHAWAERTGNDPFGPEAEEVFIQAYNDASQAGDR